MAADGPARSFRGTVEVGDARGRTIGFPTANVAVADELRKTLPRGVHVGTARVHGREYGAVVNIGRRPTFGASQVSVEVHLLDFADEIYGQELEVWLTAKLRDEQRFATPGELVEQIRRDVARARALLVAADGPSTQDTARG